MTIIIYLRLPTNELLGTTDIWFPAPRIILHGRFINNLAVRTYRMPIRTLIMPS